MGKAMIANDRNELPRGNGPLDRATKMPNVLLGVVIDEDVEDDGERSVLGDAHRQAAPERRVGGLKSRRVPWRWRGGEARAIKAAILTSHKKKHGATNKVARGKR